MGDRIGPLGGESRFDATVGPAVTVTKVANDAALRNLVEKIDHIVVVMLENRSFDHMLGFLTIEQGRSHVEGPTEALANEAGGETYPVHAARGTNLASGQCRRSG